MRAEVERLDPASGIAALRGAWAAVEAAGGASRAAATAGWLGAWCTHFTPRALLGARVLDGDDVIAVGLLEERSQRRWRFAGAPVTASRGLVCRPGTEAAAWHALRAWMRRSSGRWSELEVEGTPPAVVGAVPAEARAQPTYAMTLPATLEELLAARSRSARRELRKAMRLLEDAGARMHVVDAQDREAALERLVELHALRTAARGERHDGVDGRLAAMLEDVSGTGGIEVRVVEARRDGAVVASAVTLYRGELAEYYQTGMDPAATALAPGYGVLLRSLEDAMALGARRFDLGPGEYLYKSRVGGVPAEHWRVIVPSRSARGLALRGARRAAGLARQLPVVAPTVAGRGGSASSAR